MRLVVGREPRELEIKQSLLVSGLGRCISCCPMHELGALRGRGEGPGVLLEGSHDGLMLQYPKPKTRDPEP